MRGSSWGVSTSAKSKRHGLRAFREWRSVAEGIEGSGHVVCLGARSWRCLLCKEAWVENRSDQRFLTSWFILWPPEKIPYFALWLQTQAAFQRLKLAGTRM